MKEESEVERWGERDQERGEREGRVREREREKRGKSGIKCRLH